MRLERVTLHQLHAGRSELGGFTHPRVSSELGGGARADLPTPLCTPAAAVGRGPLLRSWPLLEGAGVVREVPLEQGPAVGIHRSGGTSASGGPPAEAIPGPPEARNFAMSSPCPCILHKVSVPGRQRQALGNSASNTELGGLFH